MRIKYGETVAAARRIPVYLVDTSNNPVTGQVPVGAQLLVSLSGAAWVNGAGTWTERGTGNYYYEPTLAEVTTGSFLMIRVFVAAAKKFVFSVDIGTRFLINEDTASRRRVPVYMIDATGVELASLTFAGAEKQVSERGAAFADAGGAITEIGGTGLGLGAYYYDAPQTDVDSVGYGVLKVIKTGAVPYIYVWSVSDTPFDPVTADSTIAIMATDQFRAPLAGLTPTWVSYVDAATGIAQSQPAFTALSLGHYKFTPTGTTPAGLIDFGITAVPRYVVYAAFSAFVVFGAFDEDGVPITGLTPTWASLRLVADGSAYAQPIISALGNGLYKTDYIGAHCSGAIDLGVTAYPRYFHYDSESPLVGPPSGDSDGYIVVAPATTSMLSRFTEIIIQVVADPAIGAFRRVVISATYGGSTVEELVHTGVSFSQQFAGGSNTRQVITNGYQYNLLRLGGWRGTSVTLRIVAIDVYGNLLKKTVAVPETQYTWQVAGGSGNVTPFVGGR